MRSADSHFSKDTMLITKDEQRVTFTQYFTVKAIFTHEQSFVTNEGVKSTAIAMTTSRECSNHFAETVITKRRGECSDLLGETDVMTLKKQH